MGIPTGVFFDTATQAESEAGIRDDVGMTPLGTKQAIAAQAGGTSLPLQTGNNGKVLGTDGSTASWVAQSGGSLPSQTGNSGKFLTTDGTNPGWVVSTGGGSTILYGSSTADFSKTSDTTLAVITGCSVSLTAGKRYEISGWVQATSASAGGIKAALVASGGLTATKINGECLVNGGVTAQLRISTLGSNIANSTGVVAPFFQFYGHINVNVAGSLQLHFAQSASNGTASVALEGAFIRAELLN